MISKKTLALFIAGSLTACSSDNSINSNETPSTADRNPEIWPVVESSVAADQEIEAQIDALIASMPLEYKVAQMVQGEIRHVTPEDVRKYRLGSVLNGGGSFPNQDRAASVADWVALADSLYDASVSEGLDFQPIPIIWGTDAVHGHNNVRGATLFPHNIGLGAARNPQLIYEIGRATAEQVTATAIDWTFAPTVAVSMDYRWGRAYESYGQDPALVHDYSASVVYGLQGGRNDEVFSRSTQVVSTVKHFLGDGGTTRGVDQGDTAISEQELFDIHAQGYVGGLNAGAQTVMASFNSWNGEKLHGHQYLLTDVLKDRMGFDGFVVGDWNGHGQLPGCTVERCAQAINAGVDMIMVPEDWEAFLLNTVEDVRNGDISEARIDDAVRRILRVKFRAGVMSSVKPSERENVGDVALIDNPRHREIAQRAARESQVLLKNDGVLPLSGEERVVILGNGAEDISRQLGGWSITWQGTETTAEDFPNVTSIAEAISNILEANGGTVVSADTFDGNAASADVAVVIFGEPPYAEFNGDRTHVVYSELDQESLALLSSLKEQGIPVVSVFLSGRPMWTNPEINRSNAFVASWLPGSMGQGVAELLFADSGYDYSGQLPGEWPLAPNFDRVIEMGRAGSYANGAILDDVMLDENYQIDDGNQASLDLFKGKVGDEFQMVMSSAAESTLVNDKVVSAFGMTVAASDYRVQEDARTLSFASAGQSVDFVANSPLNLVDWRRDDAVIRFAMQSSDTSALALTVNSQHLTNSVNLSNVPSGDWVEVSMPLYCLIPDAHALSSVQAIGFAADGAAQVTIAAMEITLSNDGTDVTCGNGWAGTATGDLIWNED
ncbi:MAG: glycoside hydrolase family 3 C-terminal domain-containing protein [Gammaproteobacteria bacterium]|nr:glycoside hydrolase family 3 C-terminal domain-containing protein [Gammaproteobacteria bacterium]